MPESFEKTKKLFDTIKDFGFFKRLFYWKYVIGLAIDASKEFAHIDEKPTQLSAEIARLEKELEKFKANLENEKENKQKALDDYKSLKKDYDNLNKEYTEAQKRVADFENEKENKQKALNDYKYLKKDYDNLNKEYTETQKRVAEFEKLEEDRQKKHEKEVQRLSDLQQKAEDRISKLEEEREQEIKQKFEDMKRTWQNHEDSVEQTVRNICKKHGITYIGKEKFPHKKKPDNSVFIAQEYIIFDAKSPAGDDISKFPNYLKRQAEEVKKYTTNKDVKKSVFLVVPTNTISYVEDRAIDMGEYDVYIVTEDSLEPILLSLQKIEEYEITDSLTPEQRDNISRTIGRFAHTIKRRVQVDHYFTSRFIQVLSMAEEVPEEILEKAKDYETSGEVLNPPQERKNKKIASDSLQKESKKISKEAEAKEIDIERDMSKIEEIPLNKNK